MAKPTLCVDFDGVVHLYITPWSGLDKVNDPPVPGAFPWLLRAVDHFDVQIYSTRSVTENGISGIQTMYNWFAKWAPIEFLGHQESVDKLLDNLKFPSSKPKPFLTIDDRALTFNGDWSDPQWEPEVLLSFKPWNRPWVKKK